MTAALKLQPQVEQLYVIHTNDEIDALIEYLSDPSLEMAAYDTETTSLSPDAQVVGLSVCAEDNVAWYVILGEWHPEFGAVQCEDCEGSGKGDKQNLPCATCYGVGTVTKAISGELKWHDNREKVIELLKVLKTKALIMHNATVDVQWTKKNFNINLRESLAFESMAAAHLLNENRRVGLKELGYAEYGEDAKKEQQEMQASVVANGGIWEEKRGGNKEMYKASPHVLGKYGAKDALLTYRLGVKFAAQLVDRGLDAFYFEETLPLAKGPIYDLNTTGIRVDVDALKRLQKELEDECSVLKHAIETDIAPYTSETFPKGFGKKKGQFNIGSGQHLSWLIFIKLKQDWKKLTEGGRDLAKQLLGKAPYNPSGRRNFVSAVADSVDAKGRPLKLEKYLCCNKTVLTPLSQKYQWIDNLLKYKKSLKLLNTYVIGMQDKITYGVIRPSFLQHGTTGNRLSSRGPNFQNLPRDDKRTKKCFIARPGRIFVGSDYKQIEPRCFASQSGDVQLLECFEKGYDFYSVVGIRTFQKYECTPYKSGPNAFGERYPLLRQVAKEIALAATYGITAFKLTDVLNTKAPRLGNPWTVDEVQEIIDAYFEAYPDVKKLQLKYHQQAIEHGVVYNLFGRPRHIPKARFIKTLGKNIKAEELPYEYRTLLNNAVNFPVQGTAGSIINRAMIAVRQKADDRVKEVPEWADVKIIGMVHDEIWLEGPERLSKEMISLLKECMETAAVLPGVKLEADPIAAYNLADLK